MRSLVMSSFNVGQVFGRQIYDICFFLQRDIETITVVGTPRYAAIGQCMTNRDGVVDKESKLLVCFFRKDTAMSASKLNIWRKVTSVNVAISWFFPCKGESQP